MNKYFIFFLLMVTSTMGFSQDNSVQKPVENFDYLWNTFHKRYSNFELKKINWNHTYSKYRSLISNTTTNDELFRICNKMILSLKDGHSTITQNDQNGNFIKEGGDGSLPSLIKTFPFDKNHQHSFFKLINLSTKTLTKHAFQNFHTSKENVLTYASNNHIGYLRIRYMSKFSTENYKKIIEQALSTFQNKKGLILDLRFNPGGHNHISNMIANHFTDTKRVAHYYRKRIPKTNNFTKLKLRYIKSNRNITFTKPILILTSDFTASAAETFILSMKQLPHVTVLGDNTNGVFSEIYTFKLPNKWDVTLSYQQYFSANKINYEGVGVPPDFYLQNTINDFVNQEDVLITRALSILNKS